MVLTFVRINNNNAVCVSMCLKVMCAQKPDSMVYITVLLASIIIIMQYRVMF